MIDDQRVILTTESRLYRVSYNIVRECGSIRTLYDLAKDTSTTWRESRAELRQNKRCRLSLTAYSRSEGSHSG
jgi:hypothetical protein